MTFKVYENDKTFEIDIVTISKDEKELVEGFKKAFNNMNIKASTLRKFCRINGLQYAEITSTKND